MLAEPARTGCPGWQRAGSRSVVRIPPLPVSAGRRQRPSTRVLRRIDREGGHPRGAGHIQDPCGFQDEDSDLLPAETPLHPVDGVPGRQGLGGVLKGRLLIFAMHVLPVDAFARTRAAHDASRTAHIDAVRHVALARRGTSLFC